MSFLKRFQHRRDKSQHSYPNATLTVTRPLVLMLVVGRKCSSRNPTKPNDADVFSPRTAPRSRALNPAFPRTAEPFSPLLVFEVTVLVLMLVLAWVCVVTLLVCGVRLVGRFGGGRAVRAKCPRPRPSFAAPSVGLFVQS